jgi:crotonobetainyl-CoA:carnitine CoA-transferase CaiB-like acyl-CoA transferase
MSLTTQIWNWTDQGQFLLPKTQPPGVHQLSIYECANGEWIHASTMSGVPPKRSEASILGLDDDVTQTNLLTMDAPQREAYETRRRAAFKLRNRAELIEEFHEAGLGAEAVVAPHERFDHPQLQATGSVVEVVDPEVGPTTQVGVTIFLDGTPGAVQGPQPIAGADTADVLRSLGHGDDELAALRSKGVI